MKIILYKWGSNSDGILEKNLSATGNIVVPFERKCNHYTRDMDFAGELIGLVHSFGAEAIVSFNYFPVISLVCDVAKIEYYSWVYDCPHFTLYAKTVALSCNHIATFDKCTSDWFAEQGITTVKHLPLAVDDTVFANAGKQKVRNFSADVSFVGSLYTDAHNYFDAIFDKKSEEEKAIITQSFNYEREIDSVVSESALNKTVAMMKERGMMLGDDYMQVQKEIAMAAVFEKKLTVLERDMLLRRVEKMDTIDFKLYTKSETDIKNYGTVDYFTQMPQVFRQSRINLNISLRSIKSGIPLRVLDILACGGFVLTNYQPEIDEYFEDGKEIVQFRSLDDCIDKINYYLSHEEERAEIARNGHRAVREKFSYKQMLDKLFAE